MGASLLASKSTQDKRTVTDERTLYLTTIKPMFQSEEERMDVIARNHGRAAHLALEQKHRWNTMKAVLSYEARERSRVSSGDLGID